MGLDMNVAMIAAVSEPAPPRADPLDYLAGPNLYEYVSGNPIKRVDPDGTIYTLPDFVNCLGYATGGADAIGPDIAKSESFEKLMESLGWT